MSSTEELVARARAEAVNLEGDSELYWKLVEELHDRDPAEVWALISPLATDPNILLQLLVPDVLHKLGHEAQPLAAQTLELFAKMLASSPPAELITAIATVCASLHDPSVAEMLAPFAGHADLAVRRAVLQAIRRSGRAEAQAALILLSRDEDQSVREWATFALGSQLPLIDSPEIREALAARLTDRWESIRDEAIVGLGLRGDQRALGPLRTQFERGFTGLALFEAARALASPVLLAPLRALKADKLPKEEQDELAAAIEACSTTPK